jgi:hypothetical protein
VLDDAGSKIEHETNNALTLPGHARTPSGCKSGDIKRTIIKKSAACGAGEYYETSGEGLPRANPALAVGRCAPACYLL